MKTSVTYFNVTRSGSLIFLKRNGVDEVKIFCPARAEAETLQRYLRELLPNDYLEYLEFEGLKEEHSIFWLSNLLIHDRSVLDLFEKIRKA